MNMNNPTPFFAVSIMIIGIMLLPAVFGAASAHGTHYAGVYQCKLQGDAQFDGFVKITQINGEARLEVSWDPGVLPGAVSGQTLRFEANSATVTLTFTEDGTVFQGNWRRVSANAAGTISGVKVEPSRWPISDFNTLPAKPDTDKDGLPDEMEQEYGTDATQVDSDGDTLSDYAETRKYRTDPLSPDSDGDGKNDSVWEERREYTYTIQAIVDLRPPFDVSHMNDFYQDARLIEDLGNDVSRVEIVLYPEAQVVLNPSVYQAVQDVYTELTYTKNYSHRMADRLEGMVKGVDTDIQAIASILDEFKTISYVDIQKDLGYQSDLPLYFNVYVDSRGNVVEEGLSGTTSHSLDELKAHTLFAESMYQFKTYGACGSKATLRGAMLRAVGIPEKTIVTIPLLYTYDTDTTDIQIKAQYYDRELLNIPSQVVRGVDHFFNEALIGNQWVRVDHKIDTGVRTPNRVGIKILEAHDTTSYRFATYWNYDTWLEKRPYQYVSVIEREALHK